MNEITTVSAGGADTGATALAMLAGEKRPELLRDEVLAEIFAASVSARPDHPAMICGDLRLSYAQVWAQAQAQARGLALAGIGLLPESAVPELAAKRKFLRRGTRKLPRVVEIRHRHPVDPADDFRMLPGFVGFQRVSEGTLLARDRQGDVRAVLGGRLLMPLYQEQGNDGFFLVRTVRPIWLRVSAVLRHIRAERFLHWLPGVRRATAGHDDFIVDQHIARWLAVQILHLLGFRRHGHQDDGSLLVSRRPNE